MSPSIRFSQRLYAVLLPLYPVPLRRQFGNEMMEVFTEQIRDAHHKDGWIGELAIWCCVASETLSTVASSYAQIAGISVISTLAALGLTCTFICIASGN